MVCAITRSGGQQSSLYYFMQSKRVCLTASSCGLFCVPHSEYSSYTIFWLLFCVPHSEYSSHTIFWLLFCVPHSKYSSYTIFWLLFWVPHSEYSSHTIFWRTVLCTIHEFSTYTVCGVLSTIPECGVQFLLLFCFVCFSPSCCLYHALNTIFVLES